MRRLRALTVGLALLTGSAWPVVGAAGPACADDGPRAGLVIDTGPRVQTYCVALDAASVTGLHLIELAHDQHGLDYRFGLGGAAVCRLAGTGVNVDDCFADYPTYWGYWTSDGEGAWAWSSQGALDVRVRDGDLQGWVWGEGDTGETHDAPTPVRAGDVCPPEPAGSPTTTSEPATPPATPSSTPAATTPTQTRNPSPDRSAAPTPAHTTLATSSPVVLAAPADPGGPTAASGDGLPAGLLAGLAIALLLMAAGFLRLRGRSEGLS